MKKKYKWKQMSYGDEMLLLECCPDSSHAIYHTYKNEFRIWLTHDNPYSAKDIDDDFPILIDAGPKDAIDSKKQEIADEIIKALA